MGERVIHRFASGRRGTQSIPVSVAIALSSRGSDGPSGASQLDVIPS